MEGLSPPPVFDTSVNTHTVRGNRAEGSPEAFPTKN